MILILAFLSTAAVPNDITAQIPRKPSDLDTTERETHRFDKFGGVVYREFEELNDDGEPLQLKCDVYVPRGDGPYPAILAVNGGGWRSGSKLNLFRHARVLAKAGYVVVSINYRLAPRHRFPAQVEDAVYAIAWMRENAEEYKIDVERIGAWGYSAGGHIVSMLGVTDREDGFAESLPDEWRETDLSVAAVAAGGAPCYLGWIPDDSRILAYWLGDSRRNDAEIYQRAEPMSYVDEHAPPFFFFHGTDDHLVPVRGSKVFHQKLQSAGIESEFLEHLGDGHFATFSDLSTLDACVEFFDAKLKTDPNEGTTDK